MLKNTISISLSRNDAVILKMALQGCRSRLSGEYTRKMNKIYQDIDKKLYPDEEPGDIYENWNVTQG